MSEYRVSYLKVEEGVAKLGLYENDDFQENIYYDIEDMPDGTGPTDQFKPEFNDDGEVVALHYDEELTERKARDFRDVIEQHNERLDDN